MTMLSINILKIEAMTKKNFNAKKMLMSMVAAVVFSFTFTTSANATSQAENPQKSSLEIRVKGAQKGNVGIRVKGAQKGNLEVRVKDDPNLFEEFLDKILGIRVKVRV